MRAGIRVWPRSCRVWGILVDNMVPEPVETMEYRYAEEADAPFLADINRQLIEDEWDDALRLSGSLNTAVTAS